MRYDRHIGTYILKSEGTTLQKSHFNEDRPMEEQCSAGIFIETLHKVGLSCFTVKAYSAKIYF